MTEPTLTITMTIQTASELLFGNARVVQYFVRHLHFVVPPRVIVPTHNKAIYLLYLSRCVFRTNLQSGERKLLQTNYCRECSVPFTLRILLPLFASLDSARVHTRARTKRTDGRSLSFDRSSLEKKKKNLPTSIIFSRIELYRH